ncbi:AMP-binding protein [Rhizorhabdus dicambivorans]|uniref:AMP-dependent synthetase n=1 Tax=Rhizorhabdus dicambivorans TaxID=1850238 RepID=A0A2A4FV21_9SPHN|nr:AMP-binding protein [Rhizorhabdus dicambivorans]ATE63917.1 AMP-dependent synthetase [Rhizorhabdus dicambivorans]PCE41522.1 AMP-dependent synthetase [Rhizorhabdus dicambivorans]
MDDAVSPHFSGLTISLEHTLPELIAHVAATYGDTPFVVGEDGRATSFAGFAERVNRLAAALVAQGIAHGDRVAIWAPNSPEWMIAASAIESIGAVMVPINTRFKGGEALYALGKTRARLLFTVGSFLGNDYVAMLAQAGDGLGAAGPVAALPALERIVLLDDASLAVFEAKQCGEAELAAHIAAVRPDSIADILFTSGTTGYPKGAMHNHGQALWMVANWNRSNDLHAGDRALIVNPFFHSFGYRSGWVSGLVAGMTVFPVASFDPEAVLALIERERISVLMGPPTIFTSLMEHPRFGDFDISSLRVGHTGASNVPVELIRAGREVFGFDLFLTSFGQTETTALVTVNYPDSDFETIARTVGVPLPGVEVRIAEDTGELLVRGPNVMQGYFEDPEQTAATIDADGWLHTGDVACLNPNGTVRILDRLKDVVIVGGFNAYPAEVENILRAHPAIADICIIGWPDDRMGEVCAACVILRSGASLTLAELTAWSRERMANYKVPRHLFLVEDFPRTPLGKIQKFVLRDRLTA